MITGYTRPLYNLPFDHRASYIWGLFGWKEPLNAEQTVTVANSKQVIYAGFQQALHSLKLLYFDCGSRDQYQLQFGARLLARALTQAGISYEYEEFDDDHTNIAYRNNVSLPKLWSSVRALSMPTCAPSIANWALPRATPPSALRSNTSSTSCILFRSLLHGLPPRIPPHRWADRHLYLGKVRAVRQCPAPASLPDRQAEYVALPM